MLLQTCNLLIEILSKEIPKEYKIKIIETISQKAKSLNEALIERTFEILVNVS